MDEGLKCQPPQTQTHIVYRNRLEHDFYESGMMIPLIGGLLAGFVVFLALAALAKKISRDWRGPSNTAIGTAAVLALIAGGGVFHWLSF